MDEAEEVKKPTQPESTVNIDDKAKGSREKKEDALVIADILVNGKSVKFGVFEIVNVMADLEGCHNY